LWASRWTKYTPDHSTILAHAAPDRSGHASRGVCLGAGSAGQGQQIAIDATTLEANAAMRSIVRRDTGESYEDLLRGLVKASGIETPAVAEQVGREAELRPDEAPKVNGAGIEETGYR
jgi:transposase